MEEINGTESLIKGKIQRIAHSKCFVVDNIDKYISSEFAFLFHFNNINSVSEFEKYIFDNETLNKLKSSDIDLTKALQTRTFNLYIDIGVEDVNLVILGASIYYLLQNIGKVYTEKYNYLNYLLLLLSQFPH